MSSWYEILEQRNKEIEALKSQIEELEQNKASIEQRIKEEETKNKSNQKGLTKESIINMIQNLQNKIDNFHFKGELKIESDFTINKLSLVYSYEDFLHEEISTSGATMLYELDKWLKFQSRLIPIYKFLEDENESLIYARVKSKYNNNYKNSILTFLYNPDDNYYKKISYSLEFNKNDYKTFNLSAWRKIIADAVKCNLSLDNKGLEAHIITPEAEEEFDSRDFDPSENFNIYLITTRKNIDETILKDAIEETSKQILNYTNFKEDCW